MRDYILGRMTIAVGFGVIMQSTPATAQVPDSGYRQGVQNVPPTTPAQYPPCDDPESHQPSPCYVATEELFSTTRSHEDARALVLCTEGLAAANPENPFVLIHLALAYTHNASYLDSWIALEKAQRLANTACVLGRKAGDRFNRIASSLREDLRQTGQATRLHFSNQRVSDIAIDGTLVADAASAELPLTIGGHTFRWKQDGQTCYLHERIHFDPARVVRVELACNERHACPLDADNCNQPECNDKCKWTPDHCQKEFPCKECHQPVQIPPDRLFYIGEGLVAVGVAGAVGFGLGFGLASRSNQKDADAHCGTGGGFSDPNACTAEGYASDRAARAYEKAAYWSVSVGAATAIAGAAMMIPWRKIFGGGTANDSQSLRGDSFRVAFVPVVGPTETGFSLQTAW